MKMFIWIVFFTTIGLEGFEFQKAKTYHNENVSGWLMSEKLDGIRGCWDGKKLITKNGYKIHVPKFFTKNFPTFALDGELWIKRDAYEQIESIVLDDQPSKEWKLVTYNIFEVPKADGNFRQRIQKAKNWFLNHPNIYVQIIKQKICKNKEELMQFLEKVDAKGGEGVMVKNPSLNYFDGRSANILKVKKYKDTEGRVVAINVGRGKYQNMMGSLTIEMKNGIRFKLGTGFSEEERKNPPEIGKIIVFKYFGWTKNHKPKFASYLRQRDIRTMTKE